MSLKRNIIKIGLMVLWIALASCLLVLLVAAAKKKDLKSCKGVEIEISGVEGKYCFLDKQDVLGIIDVKSQAKLKGRSVSSFNLQRLEGLLEKNIWVKDAELFFDNNLVLHINIAERQPVARVFTVTGNSFYIDSSGMMLPLSSKMNVRLPVFTNYPWEKTRGIGKAGNATVEDMKKISWFIINDQFWSAQIAQIDIVGNSNFEMIPTIGNHLIEFGNGTDHRIKFNRLFVFYKEILGKTGFNKYSRIDVRYDNQVLGTKRGSVTKVDSVQAMKNINKLIMAGILPKDTNQINSN